MGIRYFYPGKKAEGYREVVRIGDGPAYIGLGC